MINFIKKEKLFLISFILFYLFLFLFYPALSQHSSMWAEGGTRYFYISHYDNHNFWQQITAKDVGYFVVFPRLVAYLISLSNLSVSNYAIVYGNIALIFIALFSSSICLKFFRNLIESDILRFLIALVFVLQPDFELKTYTNFIYYAFIPLILVLLNFEFIERCNYIQLFFLSFIFSIIILSKAFFVILLPILILILIYALALRKYKTSLFSFILISSCVVQLILSFLNRNEFGDLNYKEPGYDFGLFFKFIVTLIWSFSAIIYQMILLMLRKSFLWILVIFCFLMRKRSIFIVNLANIKEFLKKLKIKDFIENKKLRIIVFLFLTVISSVFLGVLVIKSFILKPFTLHDDNFYLSRQFFCAMISIFFLIFFLIKFLFKKPYANFIVILFLFTNYVFNLKPMRLYRKDNKRQWPNFAYFANWKTFASNQNKRDKFCVLLNPMGWQINCRFVELPDREILYFEQDFRDVKNIFIDVSKNINDEIEFIGLMFDKSINKHRVIEIIAYNKYNDIIDIAKRLKPDNFPITYFKFSKKINNIEKIELKGLKDEKILFDSKLDKPVLILFVSDFNNNPIR